MDDGFVGRAAAQAAIDSMLERARQGRPQPLAIVGGPGVGKTTALERLAAEADRLGFRSIVIRADRTDAGVPFAALRPALDGALEAERRSLAPPGGRGARPVAVRPDRGPGRPGVVLDALRAVVEGWAFHCPGARRPRRPPRRRSGHGIRAAVPPAPGATPAGAGRRHQPGCPLPGGRAGRRPRAVRAGRRPRGDPPRAPHRGGAGRPGAPAPRRRAVARAGADAGGPLRRRPLLRGRAPRRPRCGGCPDQARRRARRQPGPSRSCRGGRRPRCSTGCSSSVPTPGPSPPRRRCSPTSGSATSRCWRTWRAWTTVRTEAAFDVLVRAGVLVADEGAYHFTHAIVRDAVYERSRSGRPSSAARPRSPGR